MSSTLSDRVRAPGLRKVLSGAAVVILLSTAAAATVSAESVGGIARPEGIVTASQAEVFVSISPTRVLDTRGPASGGPVGVPTAAKLQPNSTLDLTMTGAGKPVPEGATAVVLNTTIDLDATDRSFISIYPKGQSRSSASANNALPGLEVSNLTIARLGTGGAISIYNLKGEINLVLDVVGYLVPLTSVDGIAGGGNTILNGTGAPASTTGNNGDYYIDNATKGLYGPKTNGAWPAPPTSLVGAPGAPGAPGLAGPTISTLGTFEDTPVTLPAGGDAIDFDPTNDVRAGDAGSIVHALATPETFTLAAGTYLVDYRVTLGAAASSGGFQLALDGQPVGAATAVIPAATAGASVTDSVVIAVPAGGADLTLEATDLLALTIGSSSIVVERIA